MDADRLFADVPYGIDVADRLRGHSLTEAQSEALRTYTESPALNAAIRSGQVTASVQRWIERIDSAMAGLPVPIRATRALDASKAFESFGIGSAVSIGEIVGEVIDEPAYLSVCLLASPPADLVRDVPTRQRLVLEFLIAAGTPAVYVEPVTAFRSEHELIVMRSLRFRIVSDPTFVSIAAGWRSRAIIDVRGDR